MLILWLCIAFASIVAVVFYVCSKVPRLQLKGQRVIVTGGSSGIGYATAMLLAQRGAKLALLARDPKKLDQAVKAINCKYPDAAFSICADICDNNSVSEAIGKAAALMGGLDIVIHSAGISRPGRFMEIPVEEFNKVMTTNYMGTVYVTRACVPHMQHGGRVMYMASLAGMTSVAGLSAYSPSKFAVRGLAEGLQMELAPLGINFTVVNPPDVKTPMYDWELQHKPVECKRISEGSGLFEASVVANDIVKGIENWSFYVSTGFDGVLSNSLCAGMAPASSILVTVLEVFFLGIVRLVSLFYLKSFNKICMEEHLKKQKSN